MRLQNVCRNCNTPNSFESAFCRQCGASFTGAETGQSLTAIRQADELAIPAGCPRCHSVNEPGAAFCFSCGLPFDEQRVPASAIVAATRPAGFWIRFVAQMIDGVPLLIIGVILGVFAAAFGGPEAITLLVFVAGPLYYTLGVSVWSTTLGKRAMGIYVLRPDGSKVGPGRAFCRYLAYFPSSFLLYIGYLMAAFRDDKRALHDLMCDTVVVFRR